jgi:hypothetical protein
MATAVTPPAPTTGGAMTGAVRPYEGDMLSYGQGPEHRWFEPAVMGTPATGGGVPTGPTAPGAWQSPEGTNVFQDYASAATGGGTGSTPGQISNVIAPVMQQMAANYGGGGIPSVGGVDGLLPTAGMDGLASSLGLIDYGSSWYGSDPATQIFNRPVEGAVPYGEYGESLLGAVQLLDPTPISSLIGIGMDLNNVSAVRDAYQKLIDMGIYSGELPTGMEAAGQYLGALLPFGLGNGYGSGNTKAVLDMGYYNDDRINSQAFLEATLNAGMIPLPSAMSDPVKGVDPNTGEMAFTPDEINAYQDAYFPGGDFAWTDPGSVENRTLGSVENPTEAAELTTNTGGPSYFQHASTLIPTVEPTIAPTLPTPIAPTLPPVEIDTPLSSYVPPAPILTPPPPPGGGRGAVSRALPAPAPTPTYSFPSSKRFKNTYAQAQPGEMLRSLRGMPLHLWRYKEVTPAANDAPHVGPYAEDWLEHTGLGDGQSINAVDAIGMLLGAVQALDAEVRELRAERQAQEKVRFLKHPSRGVLLSRQGN